MRGGSAPTSSEPPAGQSPIASVTSSSSSSSSPLASSPSTAAFAAAKTLCQTATPPSSETALRDRVAAAAAPSSLRIPRLAFVRSLLSLTSWECEWEGDKQTENKDVIERDNAFLSASPHSLAAAEVDRGPRLSSLAAILRRARA